MSSRKGGKNAGQYGSHSAGDVHDACVGDNSNTFAAQWMLWLSGITSERTMILLILAQEHGVLVHNDTLAVDLVAFDMTRSRVFLGAEAARN
jgi:hypothetical protein